MGDPTVASDANVAAYATDYFQYDQLHRVTLHDVQGDGGTTTGTYGQRRHRWVHLSILCQPDVLQRFQRLGKQDRHNHARRKSRHRLPKRQGAALIDDFYDIHDPSSNRSLDGSHRITYYVYNSGGQLVEEAEPSAVSGYTLDGASLDVTLNSASGTIYTYAYYAADGSGNTVTSGGSGANSTGLTPGGIKGYLEHSYVQEGGSGTAVTLETLAYYQVSATVGLATAASVVVASDQVYSSSTASATTTYDYTWYASSVAVEMVTTHLPNVSDEGLGHGTGEATAVVYDSYSCAAWTKDADGYIGYIAYDAATGELWPRRSRTSTARPSHPLGVGRNRLDRFLPAAG